MNAKGSDGDEFIPLGEVAANLRTNPSTLLRLARQQKFCDILRVTPKHCLVRRVDFELWKAGAWVSVASSRAALVKEAVLGQVVNKRSKWRT